MHKMLHVSEEYATAYSVLLNAAKSYYMVCESTYKPKTCFSSTNAMLIINGCPIKAVDSGAHLGHMISHDSDDSLGILRWCDKLIGRLTMCFACSISLTLQLKMIYSECECVGS